MTDDLPQSLLDAVRHFSDLAACNALMLKIKWPSGRVVCPHCGGERCAEKADGKRLRCRDCRKDFSYKVGTIFEDSPLGLDKWFVAVWSIANCKNGISSHELGRALGVTQKTAWFMLHRIREAMKTGTFTRLKAEIETDETFVGGKARNMHADKREKRIKGRGAVGKAIIHGMLERGGEVRASVVRDTEATTLQPLVRQHAEHGAYLYSDAMPSYRGLGGDYAHRFVDHASKYVEGRVHVNGMENFWSLLKRSLGGTYVAVAPFHLLRYVDEQVFRFNARRTNDAARFLAALIGVVGKRLTYRQLAAIDDCGFMGIQ
jgi:transposase-like protein